MKRSFPLLYTSFVLAGCIAVALSPAIRADDGDDNEQGGDIQGSEQTNQKVALVATADAPAGAAGKAELEAEDEDGTTTAVLTIEPKGLADGTYTVSATLKSDPTAAPVVLGTFDVVSDSSDDPSGGDNDGGVTASKDQDDDDEGEVQFGDEGTPFPAGFNAFDIASISITDANNVVELTGDFAGSAADLSIHASVNVTPGPVAATATGHAVFSARAKHGKTRSLFVMGAKNVPANATFTLQVNGTPVGSVKSSKHGRVTVKAPKGLPGGIDPFTVHSVTVVDGSGAHVVDVNF